MKKFNQKWHFILGRGIHPVIVMDLIWKGHTQFFGKILNLPFNIYFMKRYEGATYFLEKEYQKILRYFKKKLEKNPKEFYQFIDFFSKKNQNLTDYLKKLNLKKIKNWPDEKIKEILTHFFEEYSKITVHFYLPFFVEDLLIKELKKIITPKLRKLGKEDKFEEYLFYLTQDLKGSGANKEKIELLKIAIQIYNNKKLSNIFRKSTISQIKKWLSESSFGKKILAHQKRHFGTYTYLFKVKEYTLEDVIKNIKEFIKDNPEKALKENYLSQNKLRKTQEKILKELKFSKNELKILKLAQDYVYFRNIRVTQMGLFQCLIKSILSEWARRLNLNYDEILYLTSNEILIRKFNRNILKKRIMGYVYLLENGRQHLITGKAKDEFLKKEKEGEKKHKEEIIKGLPVFLGKTKGIVRKATPYTFDQIKKGDVLVCGMTIVEATPYLGRCKAIITDEGGITCHAAVVSRELKIPCIVGTKIATKVLKDGDLVEVDANKGVVKIIKKK